MNDTQTWTPVSTPQHLVVPSVQPKTVLGPVCLLCPGLRPHEPNYSFVLEGVIILTKTQIYGTMNVYKSLQDNAVKTKGPFGNVFTVLEVWVGRGTNIYSTHFLRVVSELQCDPKH